MKHNLYNTIIKKISADIAAGKYKADEKLPSEKSLAAIYKVSLITIRRVTQELQHSGLIYSVHGKGSFVSLQKLSASAPHTITFLIDTLQGYYALQSIAAVENALSERGYSLILKEARFDSALHTRYIEELDPAAVGGILIQSWQRSFDAASALRRKGIPSVFIGYPIFGKQFDYVYSNDENAFDEMFISIKNTGINKAAFVVLGTEISHLGSYIAASVLKAGYSEHSIITTVGSTTESRTQEEQRQAFEFRNSPHMIAYNQVNRFLDANTLPECFFCINDYASAGTYLALTERGIKIPDQVSIVGLSEGGDYMKLLTRKSISGMLKKTDMLASMAAKLLIEKINGATVNGTRIEVPRIWQNGDTLHKKYHLAFQRYSTEDDHDI
ncbi:MAG: GntR family transcriptional regulator [Spirochaetes bacterium]|nr:GntR family transcriptional regulator [Spirochaetota bacterium]